MNLLQSEMYNFEHTLHAVLNSKSLLDEDKRLLSSFHHWKNGSAPFTEERTSSLVMEIEQALVNREFNRRFLAFEKSLRKDEVKFPYLDILKHQQVYLAIKSFPCFNDEEKQFLSLFYKIKSKPNSATQAENIQLETLEVRISSNNSFQANFHLFEMEMEKSAIQLPYFDHLKENFLVSAIKNSKELLKKDMVFLLQFHFFMNSNASTEEAEKKQLEKYLLSFASHPIIRNAAVLPKSERLNKLLKQNDAFDSERLNNFLFQIDAFFNDREFNKRFFAFNQDLRKSGIEFPHLNKLQKKQLICVIANSNNLNDDDKKFLLLFYKIKNYPERAYLRETELLPSETRRKLRSKEFNLHLADFVEELKKNKVEFPYLDVLKHQQVYHNIDQDDHFSRDEKRYLKLFYKAKNESHLVKAEEVSELETMEANINADRIFKAKLHLFEREMRRNRIQLPYFDLLKKDLLTGVLRESKVLTPENKDFFVLFHKVMNYEASTASDQEQVAEFLNSKVKIAVVHEQILSLELEMKRNSLIFPHLDTLKNYSFGIRNIGFLNSFIKRVKVTEYIASQGGHLEQSEKLTLAELGLIEKVADLKKCIDYFEKKNIVFTSPPAKRLIRQCDSLGLMREKLRVCYQSELYQAGDVVVSDHDKTFAFQLAHYIKKPFFDKGNLFNIGKRQVSRYGHSGQLTNINGTVKQSHMWTRHLNEDFGVEHVIQSDIFRINISKLIDSTQRKALRKTLGDDWEHELLKLYADKVSEVSMSTALEKARILSGTESMGVLLPYWYGRESKNGFRLFTNNRLVKDKMICSDFVAREINEAICLVNERLEQMGEKEGLKAPIKSPFPGYVNPSRVSPEQLILLLNKAGCITKIESINLKNLVRDDRYSIVMRAQVEATAALYLKLVDLIHKSNKRSEFIREGSIAFNAYLSLNMKSDPNSTSQLWVNNLVSRTLVDLYDHHSSANDINLLTIFIKFFKKLAHYIGIYDSDSRAFIKATFDSIHKKTVPLEVQELQESNLKEEEEESQLELNP